jgi:hypothetical protein
MATKTLHFLTLFPPVAFLQVPDVAVSTHFLSLLVLLLSGTSRSTSTPLDPSTLHWLTDVSVATQPLLVHVLRKRDPLRWSAMQSLATNVLLFLCILLGHPGTCKGATEGSARKIIDALPLTLELVEHLDSSDLVSAEGSLSTKHSETSMVLSLADFSHWLERVFFSMERKMSLHEPLTSLDRCLMEVSFHFLAIHLTSPASSSALRMHFSDWLFRSGIQAKWPSLQLSPVNLN